MKKGYFWFILTRAGILTEDIIVKGPLKKACDRVLERIQKLDEKGEQVSIDYEIYESTGKDVKIYDIHLVDHPIREFFLKGIV